MATVMLIPIFVFAIIVLDIVKYEQLRAKSTIPHENLPKEFKEFCGLITECKYLEPDEVEKIFENFGKKVRCDVYGGPDWTVCLYVSSKVGGQDHYVFVKNTYRDIHVPFSSVGGTRLIKSERKVLGNEAFVFGSSYAPYPNYYEGLRGELKFGSLFNLIKTNGFLTGILRSEEVSEKSGIFTGERDCIGQKYSNNSIKVRIEKNSETGTPIYSVRQEEKLTGCEIFVDANLQENSLEYLLEIKKLKDVKLRCKNCFNYNAERQFLDSLNINYENCKCQVIKD
ncbi:MAG: hypothetical protein QXK06_03865 [Candidatus Diapherotrites archaeon]